MSSPNAFYLYDDQGAQLEVMYPGEGDLPTYAATVMLATTLSMRENGRTIRIKGGNLDHVVAITATREASS